MITIEPIILGCLTGLAAICAVNPISIRTNTEFGGSICRSPDGRFFYTRPNKGNFEKVQSSNGANDPQYNNDNFSGQDKWNAELYGDSYLGTPGGSVKRYTPIPGPSYVRIDHYNRAVFKMRYKLFVLILLMSSNAHGSPSLRFEHSYVPRKGFIPDEIAARTVAEAILSPIYGFDHIRHERPFIVRLKGDERWVSGTLEGANLGGVAEIVLSKTDGHVVNVTHGK